MKGEAKRMSDPRKTGISGITGKFATIRHATESDIVDVEEYLRKHHSDSDLKNADVVVASGPSARATRSGDSCEQFMMKRLSLATYAK
jgi:hypothetical protein